MSNHTCTDRSGHGVLVKIRLKTISGFLSVYGTYWPYVPSTDCALEGSAKLWVRIRDFCRREKMHETDPIVYIQSLIDQWISRDWEESCEGVILGGDFNSTWSRGEPGGQRNLSSWAETRFLINGPRLIQERLHIPFLLLWKVTRRRWHVD